MKSITVILGKRVQYSIVEPELIHSYRCVGKRISSRNIIVDMELRCGATNISYDSQRTTTLVFQYKYNGKACEIISMERERKLLSFLIGRFVKTAAAL